MTDKLQDVVEQFLAENSVRLFEGSNDRWVHDVTLRAFLAQVFPPGKYVLCEREPVAWLCRQTADGNVDATARHEVMRDYARFNREITELHAPAKGVE